MSRPLLPLLIALMMGIVYGHFLMPSDRLIQFCLLGVLLLLLTAYHRRWRILLSCSLIASFALVGLLLINLYSLPPEGGQLITDLSGERTTIEGVIADPPRISAAGTELVLTSVRVIEQWRYTQTKGRVLLRVREPVPFRAGDVIRCQTKLRKPRNFGNPGAFDYERSLRNRGIVVRGFVPNASGIILIRKLARNPFQDRLDRFRNHIGATVDQRAPPMEAKIIKALILGDQQEIPREIMDQFSRTGTTHIIAISGFNVGIVALFALLIIRPFLKSSQWLLLRFEVHTLATWFAILVVVGYTFVAGAGISVVRASLMIIVIMISLLLSRERDLLNTLALAALLILLASPPSLFDVSFQLSFAAVAALLFFVPRFNALLGPETGANGQPIIIWLLKKGGRSVTLFFLVSLAATLGTLPLILLYFNRLSVITLLANMLVVPILGILATPVCLLIIAAVPFSATMTEGLIGIAVPLVRVSLTLIDHMAGWSWAAVFIATPTLPEIVAFYLLLAVAGLWLQGAVEGGSYFPASSGRGGIALATITVVIGIFFAVDGWVRYDRTLQQGQLTLTFVDVGQGSAVLVRFPGGHRMLVDGGGFHDDSFDMGRAVLAPFLWQEGISRIDTVVLTHPHPDHLQGLLFILEHFGVREVWTNGDHVASPLYESFRETVHQKGIPSKILSDCNAVPPIGGVRITILNPPSPVDRGDRLAIDPSVREAGYRRTAKPPSGRALGNRPIVTDDVNERSLVIKLQFGSRSILLPGDIADAAESRLLTTGYDLKSDVLFVPHHGSRRSGNPVFLEKVNPRVAIVSCGKENPFGFPHPEILRLCQQYGISVYRTDIDGAITCRTDGRDLQMAAHRFKKNGS